MLRSNLLLRPSCISAAIPHRRLPCWVRRKTPCRIKLEALQCLEQDPLLVATLGKQAAKTFLDFKYQEWNTHNSQVTAWERAQYINC